MGCTADDFTFEESKTTDALSMNLYWHNSDDHNVAIWVDNSGD